MKKIFQIFVVLTIAVAGLASCRKGDDTVPVKSVSLNKTAMTVAVGSTDQLSVTVFPGNATDKKVYFSSDNISVAVVDESGLVTGVSVGVTVIRTADASNKYYSNPEAICAVSVHERIIPVTGVSIGKASTTVSVNGTEELNYTLIPVNAANKNVTWSSNDVSVVTVDSNGKITGISAGRATVTVTSEDGQFNASCVVTVGNETIHATGLTLDKSAIAIYVDDVEDLTATVVPEDAANKKTLWTSSNDSVVTVDDNGAVTGISAGTATVTATSEDGGFTAICTVTVASEMGNVTSTGWSTPAIHSYEHSMTYVAQVAFRDVLSEDANTEVAAFVGDECRGYAKLAYEPEVNAYLVYLVIYSNSAGGETVTLKAYNPLKERIYSDCKTFPFQGNTSLGSASEILNCLP